MASLTQNYTRVNSRAPRKSPTPLMVSVTDTCTLLGLRDRRAVYNLIRTGQLKARRVGTRLILVNYKSILAFVNGR